MQNSTRLLWRQEQALAGRRVLIADADDPDLASLPAGSLKVHSDDITVGAGDWAPLPVLDDDTDLAILPLPKSAERLELLLRTLAGARPVPPEVWLVGPAKGGIRGGVTRLKRHGDDVELVDSARHCKLYRARPRPGPVVGLAQVEKTLTVDGLTVVSYPGVFSHGRLDEGTALLLDALRESMPDGPVLDMGCGNGVLSATLARAGGRVTAVDVSATAVAATAATLERNGLSGRPRGGNLYHGLDERFQAVITNPPFHEGRDRTTDIARRLIQEAPKHLMDGGVLWMVANRELPYVQWLDEAFNQVRIVRETNRFRVYRASR